MSEKTKHFFLCSFTQSSERQKIKLHNLEINLFHFHIPLFLVKRHKFEFVDLSDLEVAAKAIDSKTKLVWIETPTNPTMKVMDIKALSDMGHKVGAKVVVDNTFASPVFQQPLSLGADAVVDVPLLDVVPAPAVVPSCLPRPWCWKARWSEGLVGT